MAVTLEELIIEFGADFSSFDREITQATNKARAFAKSLEKVVSPKVSITPKVDDRALTALNKHIELKRTHTKDVQRFLDSNPLTVRSSVDEQRTKGKPRQYSNSSEPSNRDRTVTREVVRETKQEDKQKDAKDIKDAITEGTKKGIQASKGGILGAAGRLARAPITGLADGFQQGVGITIAQSYLKGVEKQLSVSIDRLSSSVGASTANTISHVTRGTLSDVLGVNLGKVFDAIGNLDKITTPGSGANSDEKLNATNEALTAFGSELFTLLRNLGLITDKTAQQAKWLQKIGSELETKIGKAAPKTVENARTKQAPKVSQEQAVFTIGGFARAGGNSGFGIAESLKQTVDPNKVYVKGVSNKNTDIKPGTADQVALRSLEKVRQLVTEVSQDAMDLASEVIAFKNANPDTPVTLLGHSAGGSVVEQTMKLLEASGNAKNVKGVGIGAPALGLGKGKTKNYESIAGDGDIISHLNTILKGATGDDRATKARGGASHTAASYLSSPNITGAIEKATGLKLNANIKKANLQVKSTLKVLDLLGKEIANIAQLEPQFVEKAATELKQSFETIGSILERNQPDVSSNLTSAVAEGQNKLNEYLTALENQITEANEQLSNPTGSQTATQSTAQTDSAYTARMRSFVQTIGANVTAFDRLKDAVKQAQAAFQGIEKPVDITDPTIETVSVRQFPNTDDETMIDINKDFAKPVSQSEELHARANGLANLRAVQESLNQGTLENVPQQAQPYITMSLSDVKRIEGILKEPRLNKYYKNSINNGVDFGLESALKSLNAANPNKQVALPNVSKNLSDSELQAIIERETEALRSLAIATETTAQTITSSSESIAPEPQAEIGGIAGAYDTPEDLTQLQEQIAEWINKISSAMESTTGTKVNNNKLSVVKDLKGAQAAVVDQKQLVLVKQQAERLLKQTALDPFKMVLHELRHLQQPNLDSLITYEDLAEIDKAFADRIKGRAKNSVDFIRKQTSDPAVIETHEKGEFDAYAFEELYAQQVLGQLSGFSTKLVNQIQNGNSRNGNKRLQELQKLLASRSANIEKAANPLQVVQSVAAVEQSVVNIQEEVKQAVEQMAEAIALPVVTHNKNLDFSDLSPDEFYSAYEMSIRQNLGELAKKLPGKGEKNNYIHRQSNDRNFQQDLKNAWQGLGRGGEKWLKDSLSKRIKEFRTAIKNGQKKLAVDVGEALLEDVQVYRSMLAAMQSDLAATKAGGRMKDKKILEGQQGNMTALENEVLRGSNANGRSPVGIKQLVEDTEIRNYVGSKERGQGIAVNELRRNQAITEALARKNAQQQSQMIQPRVAPRFDWSQVQSDLKAGMASFKDRVKKFLGLNDPITYEPEVEVTAPKVENSEALKEAQRQAAWANKQFTNRGESAPFIIPETEEQIGMTVAQFEELQQAATDAAQALEEAQNALEETAQSSEEAGTQTGGFLGRLLDSNPLLRGFKNEILSIAGVLGSGMLLQQAGQKLFEFGKGALLVSDQIKVLRSNLNQLSGGKGQAMLDRTFAESQKMGTDFLGAARLKQGLLASTQGSALFDQAEGLATGLAGVTSKKGVDKETESRVFTAFQQVAGKGRASLEEITGQLGEALPGALAAAAASMGKTTPEFIKMVESGNVLASDLLPKLVAQLDAMSGEGVETTSKAFQKMTNEITAIQGAFGEFITPAVLISVGVFTDALGFIKANMDKIAIAMNTVGLIIAGVFLKSLASSRLFQTALQAIGGFLAGQFTGSVMKAAAALGALAKSMAIAAALQAAFELAMWFSNSGESAMTEANKKVEASALAIAEAYRKAGIEARGIPAVQRPELPQASGIGGAIDKFNNFTRNFNVFQKAADFFANRFYNDAQKKQYQKNTQAGAGAYAENESRKQTTAVINQVAPVLKANKNRLSEENVSDYVDQAKAIDAEIKNLTAQLNVLNIASEKPDAEKIKKIQEAINALQTKKGKLDEMLLPGGEEALDNLISGIEVQLGVARELFSRGFGHADLIKTLESLLAEAKSQLATFLGAAKSTATEFKNIDFRGRKIDAQNENNKEELDKSKNAAKIKLAVLQGNRSITTENAAVVAANIEKVAQEQSLKNLQAFIDDKKALLNELTESERTQVEGLLGTSIDQAGIGDINRAIDLGKDAKITGNAAAALEALRSLKTSESELSQGRATLAEQTLAVQKANDDYIRSLVAVKNPLEQIAARETGRKTDLDIRSTYASADLERNKVTGLLAPSEYTKQAAQLQAQTLQQNINSLQGFAQSRLNILSKLSGQERAELNKLLGTNNYAAASSEQIENAKVVAQQIDKIRPISGNVSAAIESLSQRKNGLRDLANASKELASVDFNAYLRQLDDIKTSLGLVTASLEGAKFSTDLDSSAARQELKSLYADNLITQNEYEQRLSNLKQDELNNQLADVEEFAAKKLAILNELTDDEYDLLTKYTNGDPMTAGLADVLQGKQLAQRDDQRAPVNANVISAMDAMESYLRDRSEIAQKQEGLLDERINRNQANMVEISFSQIESIAKTFNESVKNLQKSYKDYLTELSDKIVDIREETKDITAQLDVQNFKNSLKRALAGNKGILADIGNAVADLLVQAAEFKLEDTQGERALDKEIKTANEKLDDFQKQMADSIKTMVEAIAELGDQTIKATIKAVKGTDVTPMVAQIVQSMVGSGAGNLISQAQTANAAKKAKYGAIASQYGGQVLGGQVANTATNALNATKSTLYNAFVDFSKVYKQKSDEYEANKSAPGAMTSERHSQLMSQYSQLQSAYKVSEQVTATWNNLSATPQQLLEAIAAASTYWQASNVTQSTAITEAATSAATDSAILATAKFDRSEGNAKISELQQAGKDKLAANQQLKTAKLEESVIDFTVKINEIMETAQEGLQGKIKEVVDIQKGLRDLTKSYRGETFQNQLLDAVEGVEDAFGNYIDSTTSTLKEINKLIGEGGFTIGEVKSKIESASNLSGGQKAEILGTLEGKEETAIANDETYKQLAEILKGAIIQASSQKDDAIAFTRNKTTEQQSREFYAYESETKASEFDAQASISGIDDYTQAALTAEANLIRQNQAFQETMASAREQMRLFNLEGTAYADGVYASLARINDIKLESIRNEANLLGQQVKEGIGGALESSLAGFFKAEMTLGESLKNFAQSILKTFADMAAKFITNKIIMTIFGSAFGGGGIGGGGIFNFKNGGVVPNVANYATGGAVGLLGDSQAMMLGLGIQDAMQREGAGAVPIVASQGEHILSTRNGDAQFFRALQKSGDWENLKANKVDNFKFGGAVSNIQPVSAYQSSRKEAVTQDRSVSVRNEFNITTKDADSFKRSQRSIDADQSRQSRRNAERNQ